MNISQEKTIFHHGGNRGLYHLKNVGIIIAKKPIIIFFSDNDEIRAKFEADFIGNWVRTETCIDSNLIPIEVCETQSPVLFTLLTNNPSHALVDTIFSILVESYKLKKDNAISFDYFFLANKTKLNTNNAEQNWLVFMLKAIGIIKEEGETFKNQLKSDRAYFFPHLVVPKYMQHRFAADWKNIKLVKRLHIYIQKETGLYPLESLKIIQQKLWESQLGFIPNKHSVSSSLPKLLLYDRGDTTNRIWENAEEFFLFLQNKYSTYFSSIKYVSNEYAEMTITEQAKLFNQYEVIIAPHGAALVNVIYCKQNTLFIELHGNPPEIGWFSFCTRLGVKHVIHQPKSFSNHNSISFKTSIIALEQLLLENLPTLTEPAGNKIGKNDVTIVIPSCNRSNKLFDTLKSLVPHIKRHNLPVIIGENCRCSEAIKEVISTIKTQFSLADNIRLIDLTSQLDSKPSIGNYLNALDLLYQQVDTPYIFHTEDDWLFSEEDFLSASKIILEQYPNIKNVRLTGQEMKPLPNPTKKEVIELGKNKKIVFNYSNYGGPSGSYGAFSLHPGLRRKSDYLNYYAPYGQFKKEVEISKYGQSLGHNEAILEKIYTKHVGFDVSILGNSINN